MPGFITRILSALEVTLAVSAATITPRLLLPAAARRTTSGMTSITLQRAELWSGGSMAAKERTPASTGCVCAPSCSCCCRESSSWPG